MPPGGERSGQQQRAPTLGARCHVLADLSGYLAGPLMLSAPIWCWLVLANCDGTP
jgi:hypothetical protein